MRILKLSLAFLVLLALLAGCSGMFGSGTQSSTTPVTTTETETTAEAPPHKLAQGGENGTVWRELDLYDEANAEIYKWLETQENREVNYESSSEHKLSDIKTLFEKPKGNSGATAIWLRDEQSGEETLLFDFEAEGEHPDSGTAHVQAVLNERYFLYSIGIVETCAVAGGMIFDAQRKMIIPVEFPEDRDGHFMFAQDGVLYYGDEFYGPEQGQIHLYTLTMGEDWDTAETLTASENLLKGSPEADMGETYYYIAGFSPDLCYLLIRETHEAYAVRIFDLKNKLFVARIELKDALECFGQKENTFYFYDATWDGANKVWTIDRYALEIILP